MKMLNGLIWLCQYAFWLIILILIGAVYFGEAVQVTWFRYMGF